MGLRQNGKRHQGKSIRIIAGILGILVIGSLSILAISFQTTSHSMPPSLSRDGKRRHALIQMQLGLELYADDHESLYPLLSSRCSTIDVLESYLVPKYLLEIPKDPIYGYQNFQIAVSLDQETVILKTILEGDNNIANIALQNDIDGYVLGCNCNDPRFCVSQHANR